MELENRYKVFVVLCTHRLKSNSIVRVLDSLSNQVRTAYPWELVLVLNGPAADGEAPIFTSAPMRVLRLHTSGLTAARIAGFTSVPGALGYVLTDDDTVLASDYLRNSESLLLRHPEIGAAGGKVIPELPRPCPEWLRPSLSNLAVRDLGDKPIVSAEFSKDGRLFLTTCSDGAAPI